MGLTDGRLCSSLRGRLHRPRLAGAVALVAALLVAAGCRLAEDGKGTRGAAGPAGTAKITPSGRVYSAEDLRAAGLKVAREYDVSGLPESVAAVHGFLDQREYEARFYRSHEDALAHGQPAAAIVTGKNALVLGGNIPWEEGATDRRMCVGAINANCVAKYGDFAVFGNLVLLCEGRDSDTALETCQALLSKLPP